LNSLPPVRTPKHPHRQKPHDAANRVDWRSAARYGASIGAALCGVFLLPTRRSAARFRRDQRGNIALLFAVSLPFVLLTVGISVDFSRAATVRTQLNSAADAAVLGALTPAMLQQSASVAQAAAINMFNAQIADITGLVPGATQLTITISNATSNPAMRQVKATYTTQVQNFFGAIEPASIFALGGTSSAQASVPPNINFYLLLDNTPSMSLPSTSAGVTSMQSLTLQQENGGCAFACHQASTNNGDTQGNPCYNGSKYSSPTLDSPPPSNTPGNSYCDTSKGWTQIDNDAVARKNSIPLRLDALTSAVTTLTNLATSTATSGQFATPPKYQMAAYSTNSLWTLPTTNNQLMAMTSNYVAGWAAAVVNFAAMEMYSNNNACANSSCSAGISGAGDAETNYDSALNSINTTMPNPGNGTNVTGDTPQEVLFFVTDGVEDENNPSRTIQQINGGSAPNYCTQIKASGVKIAILYTEYLPVPVNTFYDEYVESIQAGLGPALQACASPGLFYDAALNSDLGAALSSLFQAVVQSATLTQ
jgi:Flp pilus assembly protein TadG